jgi:hypothetical protein
MFSSLFDFDDMCFIVMFGRLDKMSAMADVTSNSDFKQTVGNGLYFISSFICEINVLLSSSILILEYSVKLFRRSLSFLIA